LSLCVKKKEGKSELFARMSAESSPASAAGGECSIRPTFDQVINGKRRSPLSRDDFRAFLQSLYCEENLDFLMEVKEFEKDKSKGKAVEIVNEFIRLGGNRQINLSAMVRTKVENDITQTESQPADVFSTAESEVRKMLDPDIFIKFSDSRLNTNITREERNRRWLVSVIAFSISILMTLCLWLISPSVSRYYRIFTFVPNFIGVSFAMSARYSVCSGLAVKSRRMENGANWLTVFSAGTKATPIEDEFASRSLASRARKINIVSLLLPLPLTIISVCLGAWK